MWPLMKRPSPDQTERLIQALLEQNALLRAQLELHGGVVPPSPRIPRGPVKARTEKDVSILTREAIWEQQTRERLHQSSPSPASPSSASPIPATPESDANFSSE